MGSSFDTGAMGAMSAKGGWSAARAMSAKVPGVRTAAPEALLALFAPEAHLAPLAPLALRQDRYECAR